MAAKRARAGELRGLAEGDLKTQVESLYQELWQNRTKARLGSLQQPHKLREIRRQLARLQTILNEKVRQPKA